MMRLVPLDPFVVSVSEKVRIGGIGPLNEMDPKLVSSYIQTRASENNGVDLLWNLIRVASHSNGRLRSEDGVSNPHSPEAAVLEIILSGCETQDMGTYYPIAGSLTAVDSLLLKGKRVQAVDAAIEGKNFAMALLIASMCDRDTFQRVTRKYAEETLMNGSSLHTLAMLFSGQLQPPSDSALDRTGGCGALWNDCGDTILQTWKHNLAAVMSNRVLGWDRVVLSLGDRLMELGDVESAHFCYMVCGCPVTSLLHPSSRMSLVGCDHFVPLDASLMTSEGVSGFQRTEAYEWTKRQGNQKAVIPSLQPLKLIYAMRLADSGFTELAAQYVNSIRKSSQILPLSTNDPFTIRGGPLTAWACSEQYIFINALTELENRLIFQKNPCFIVGSIGQVKQVVSAPVSAPLLQTIQNPQEVVSPMQRRKSKKPLLDKSSTSSGKSLERGSVKKAALVHTSAEKLTQPKRSKNVSMPSPPVVATQAHSSPPVMSGSIDAHQSESEVLQTPVSQPLTPIAVPQISLSQSVLSTMLPSHDESDMNMSFLSAKSSILDNSPVSKIANDLTIVSTSVGTNHSLSNSISSSGQIKHTQFANTYSSGQRSDLTIVATSVGTNHSLPNTISSTGQIKHAQFANTFSSGQQIVKSLPPDSGLKPPMVMPPNSVRLPFAEPKEVGTEHSNDAPARAKPKSLEKSHIMPSPKSAPAQLTSTPTSAQRNSIWGMGLKSRVINWLNPDATTADIGESMKAYYDKERKVWVFPGEDPEEIAKPVGPPPMAMSTPTRDVSSSTQSDDNSLDPLAAMMAPPKRAPSSLNRPMSTSHPVPMQGMMMPPGANTLNVSALSKQAGIQSPPFMIFTPSTVNKSKNEENNMEEKK
jgi:hypothetical protein